ncbi:MAG: hypothetical protein QF435_15730, partial [Arenicellales bacterium]|nr:hypothetical protein [Arenicellales bacterium]
MVGQAVPEITREMRLGMIVVPLTEEPGSANSHTQFVAWVRREVRRAAMNNSRIVDPERSLFQVEPDRLVATSPLAAFAEQAIHAVRPRPPDEILVRNVLCRRNNLD